MLSALLLVLALQVAPAAAESTASPAPAAPAVDDTADIPHGAPKDDYGFVAWCRGALTGHIDLYPSVKGELETLARDAEAMSESKMKTEAEIAKSKAYWEKELKHRAESDEIMLAAGRDYLNLYTEALAAADAASATNQHAYGEAQRDAGFRLWAAARGADDRQRAEVWTGWELPARCEHAAKRLKDRSLLLAGVLKPQETAPPKPAPVDEVPPAPLLGEGALLVTTHPDEGARAALAAPAADAPAAAEGPKADAVADAPKPDAPGAEAPKDAVSPPEPQVEPSKLVAKPAAAKSTASRRLSAKHAAAKAAAKPSATVAASQGDVAVKPEVDGPVSAPAAATQAAPSDPPPTDAPPSLAPAAPTEAPKPLRPPLS